MDRRHGVLVRTPTWVAVLVAVLLGVGSAGLRTLVSRSSWNGPVVDLALDGPVIWPVGYASVAARLAVLAGQVSLIGLLVGFCTWIGLRLGSPRRGFWSVLLCSWFGVVLAGSVCAALIVPLYLGTLVTDGPSWLVELIAYAGGGAGWGVRIGWLPALGAALVAGAQLGRRGPTDRVELPDEAA